MEIVQITNYAEAALPLMLDQYRDSPNLRGMVGAFGAEMDKLETAMFEVRTILNIATAEGAQLDLIGRIANKGRDGLSDADYRAVLAVWFTTTSSGTPEDILRNIKETTGATDAVYMPEYPAGFVVWFHPVAGSYSQEQLESESPAGVQGFLGDILVDATDDPIQAFGNDQILVLTPLVEL